MPSNMILPNSGGDGAAISHGSTTTAQLQRVTTRIMHALLSTAAHATAVYVMALAVRESTLPVLPTQMTPQNEQESLWPLLNPRVISYDFNLIGAKRAQQPASPVDDTISNGRQSTALAVPLLIALTDQLAQSVALFLQHHRQSSAPETKQPDDGINKSLLLILAPMIALSSAATSVALSTVDLGTSLFFVPLMANRASTSLTLDLGFTNRSEMGLSVLRLFAGMGVAGLCAFVTLSATPITLPILAALSTVGPWLRDRFHVDSHTRLLQSLASTLILANLLNVVDSSFTALSTVPAIALVLYVTLSFATAWTAPKTDSDPSGFVNSLVARDVFAYLFLGLLGLGDTASSAWTKTAYLVIVGLYAVLQNGSAFPSNLRYDKYPSIDHGSRTTSIRLPLVGLVSLLTLGLVISDIHSVLSTIKLTPTPTSATAINNEHRELSPAHLIYANPNNMDPRYDFAGTLLVDPSLTDIPSHDRKSARVFALNTTDSAVTDADDRVTFQVRVPTLDKWSERPWDVVAQNQAWSKRAFGNQPEMRQEQVVTAMDQLAMGMAAVDSGDVPAALANVAFAAGTFAAARQVDCQVFWSGDEDTIAMRGKHSYFVKSFQEMVKGTGIRGPVVMKGDPNQPKQSRDVMFFKMLPYMYLTSRATTRWFLLGTDSTIWFPSNVLSFLNQLAVDPLQVPAFFAEPSPRTQSIAGSGIIISRALAALVHEHADQTCSLAGMETGASGDEMLRECIDRIARLGALSTNTSNSSPPLTKHHHQVRSLTRLPMFTSIDMRNTQDGVDLVALSGLSYLSARLSRAAPFTLHNLLALPPAQFGVYNRRYSAYKLWHLASRLPKALQFRRFYIHLDPHHHGTAVVTYGLSVRVYEMKIEQLDHTVDLDNKDMPVDQVGGLEWVLDAKIEDGPIGIKDGSVDMRRDESKWPRRHGDYEEYWLAEVDERESKMVYVCPRLGRKFMLQVKCASQAGTVGMSGLPMYDMSCLPAVA